MTVGEPVEEVKALGAHGAIAHRRMFNLILLRSLNFSHFVAHNLRRKDSLRGVGTTEISICPGNCSASHFEGLTVNLHSRYLTSAG